jgi:endonuclease YncB( thermonuclease family)
MALVTLIFKIIFILFFFIFPYFFKFEVVNGVAKVVDGDTIHIGKNKIRLHGIDAPEIDQKCFFNNEDWECGRKSTHALIEMIKNNPVQCRINGVDRYKRYIAVCFSDRKNLNKMMVKNGWAIAYRYYSNNYIDEEFIAERKKLGIWKGKFMEPYIFRSSKKE